MMVLVPVQQFEMGTNYGLYILHQCAKRVKIKSQKVLKAISNVYRSYMEKLVGATGVVFLPPKFWIELNELKREDFFIDFIKGKFLQLTAGDCAI